MASFFSRQRKVGSRRQRVHRKTVSIQKQNQVFNRANILNMQWHNHSLNLTEPAVDDFARAKIGVTIGRSLPRADWQPCRRYLRRRLARYR